MATNSVGFNNDPLIDEYIELEKRKREIKKKLKGSCIEAERDFIEFLIDEAKSGRSKEELMVEWEERGYRLRVAESQKKANQHRGMIKREIKTMMRKESYVMQNMEALAPIYKELTHAEAGVYFKLFIHLKHGEEVLRNRDGNMTMTDMCEIVGLGRSTLNNHIDVLTQKGLIIKEGTGKGIKYSLSNEYIIRGTLTNRTAFNKVFIDSAQPFFKKENLQYLDIRQLGFFIKLSMHIDLHTLVIAEDPFVKEAKDVTPMTMDGIVELMGDSKRTVGRYMNALGEAKILRWFKMGYVGEAVDIEGFFIDPKVICRGSAGSKSISDVMLHFRELKDSSYIVQTA